ncbi:MAG: hypothetical protein R3C44_05220 [Chloroflexota bacterium]
MNRFQCAAQAGSGHKLVTSRAAPLLTLILLIGLSILAIAVPGQASRVAAQDGYPAPEVPDIAPVDDSPQTNTDATQPYPAPTTDALGIIGESNQEAPANPVDQQDVGIASDTGAPTDVAQSSAGLYFLWGGFLAALLIFATAVVGSVVLFARRVEQ